MFPGHVRVGAVVSVTVTLKLHEDEFPVLSVAVQLTGVVPNGKKLPEAGAQLTVGLGSTRSVAVTL